MKIKTLLLILAASITLLTAAGANEAINTEDHKPGKTEILTSYFNNQKTHSPVYFHSREFSKNKKTKIRQQKRLEKLSKRLEKKLLKNKNQYDPDKQRLSLFSVLSGILAMTFLSMPFITFLTIPFAVAAVILGLISLKKEDVNAMNIIGLIFGGIIILLFVLGIFLALIFAF